MSSLAVSPLIMSGPPASEDWLGVIRFERYVLDRLNEITSCAQEMIDKHNHDDTTQSKQKTYRYRPDKHPDSCAEHTTCSYQYTPRN